MSIKLKIVFILFSLFFCHFLFAQQFQKEVTELKYAGELNFNKIPFENGTRGFPYFDAKSECLYYEKNGNLFLSDGENELKIDIKSFPNNDIIWFLNQGDTLLVYNSKKVIRIVNNIEDTLFTVTGTDSEINGGVFKLSKGDVISIFVKNNKTQNLDFYECNEITKQSNVLFSIQAPHFNETATASSIEYGITGIRPYKIKDKYIFKLYEKNDGIDETKIKEVENNKLVDSKQFTHSDLLGCEFKGDSFFVWYEEGDSILVQYGKLNFSNNFMKIMADRSGNEFNYYNYAATIDTDGNIFAAYSKENKINLLEFNLKDNSVSHKTLPLPDNQYSMSEIYSNLKGNDKVILGYDRVTYKSYAHLITNSSYYLNTNFPSLASPIYDNLLYNYSPQEIISLNKSNQSNAITDLNYLKGSINFIYDHFVLYKDSYSSQPKGISYLNQGKLIHLNKENGLLSDYVKNIVKIDSVTYCIISEMGLDLFDVNLMKVKTQYLYQNSYQMFDVNIPDKIIEINNEIIAYNTNTNRMFVFGKNDTVISIGANDAVIKNILRSGNNLLIQSETSKKNKVINSKIFTYNTELNKSVLIFNSDIELTLFDCKTAFSFQPGQSFKYNIDLETNSVQKVKVDFNGDLKGITNGDKSHKTGNINDSLIVYNSFDYVYMNSSDGKLRNLPKEKSYYWILNWKYGFGNVVFIENDNSIIMHDFDHHSIYKFKISSEQNIDISTIDVIKENDIFYLSYLTINDKKWVKEQFKKELPVPSLSAIKSGTETFFNFKDLSLNPSRSVTLYFSSGVFNYDKNVNYIYQLEGQDSTWQKGKNSFANYTNLDAGDYQFKVRYQNSDGNFSETSEIKFKILPPWYQTWWAYTSYSLSFCLILIGLSRIQVHFVKRKEKQKSELEILRRKSQELEKSRIMQLSMLPKENLALPYFEIVGKMRTATEVGGDYYDFMKIDENRYCVALGDATGHGNAAGLVVGMIKMALVNYVRNFNDDFNISNLMTRLNVSLKEAINYRGMGMCFCVSIIDVNSGEVEISSTGLPYPYVYIQTENKLKPLMFQGTPLGFLKKATFTNLKFTLNSGDVLVMMTDGFAERMNKTDDMYGYEQIEEKLTEIIESRMPIDNGIENLFEDNDQFSEGRINDDDMTLVVVRRK